MKKLAKKSIGGPGGPNSLRTAIKDSTAASNFEKTKAYGSASKPIKVVTALKKGSPADARKNKVTTYGSTPVKDIVLQRKGGAIKTKKK